AKQPVGSRAIVKKRTEILVEMCISEARSASIITFLHSVGVEALRAVLNILALHRCSGARMFKKTTSAM
ncbi:MAG: hypothetical protein MR592_08620, partial [Prevotella sp.]|nr:hypothetical protein [Prevotella sp.]